MAQPRPSTLCKVSILPDPRMTRVIEILGPGCPRCEKTTAEIRAVVDRAGIDAEISCVTDPFAIVARGVLFSTPVVLVDGVLVSRGRVPSRQEITRWLDVGTGPLGIGSVTASARTPAGGT